MPSAPQQRTADVPGEKTGSLRPPVHQFQPRGVSPRSCEPLTPGLLSLQVVNLHQTDPMRRYNRNLDHRAGP